MDACSCLLWALDRCFLIKKQEPKGDEHFIGNGKLRGSETLPAEGGNAYSERKLGGEDSKIEIGVNAKNQRKTAFHT